MSNRGHEHNIFYQSFGYFTLEMSVFVFVLAFSLVSSGQELCISEDLTIFASESDDSWTFWLLNY